MDRLAVMKAFCRIVERGSFARAAEDLGVSPALLSRDTKLLEQSLGCSLLTRTTRTMSLTEHGRLYYEEARRILEQIDRAEDRVRRGAGQVQGQLRINAPNSFGQMVLGPLLPGFMARYPEVELMLSLDDRVVDMIGGGFDLSIRVRADLPDSGLIARRIADIPQRLFAAPAYLRTRGVPRGPEDLRAHDTVGFVLSDEATQWTLTGPDGPTAIPLRHRLSVGSSLVLRDLLIAGQGIGSLPGFISEPAERDGLLQRVLPDHELPQRHVFAITASRLGADAKTLAFLDHLRDAMAPSG